MYFLTPEKLTRGKEETVPLASEGDERETPLEMPCAHVFGSTCLNAWLYQSPTCPLCRVEVESYADEPQQPEISPLDWQIPFHLVCPIVEQQPQRSEDMQVDPTATTTTESTDRPQPQIHPHVILQVLFTTGPPPSPHSVEMTRRFDGMSHKTNDLELFGFVMIRKFALVSKRSSSFAIKRVGSSR
jgi:hypothetical protein